MTGAARAGVLPDVPTLSESGLPSFVSGSWQGLLAPAGTPPAVIMKIHYAVVAVLKDPAYRSRLAVQSTEVVGNSPEQFAAFLRQDADTWRKVAEKARIRAE